MKEKYIRDKYGKSRIHCYIQCDTCEKWFWKRKDFLKSKNYCSPICSHKSTENKIKIQCSYCNKIFEKTPSKLKNSKSGLFFCTRKCKDLAQKLDNNILKVYSYKNGIFTYRENAIKKYGAKCELCGYDEHEEALDVHHIDRNRKNNEITNLLISCCICHRLITRKIITITNRNDIIVYKRGMGLHGVAI